ncbi:MAG: hypothetical protein LBJ01_08975 [Tannerella sp.]|jgi:hypothetical protein|nr:hypothetical protein [Tannerella sp.]
MLRRDFIMVQIEELGKVIARIISLRHADTARKNPQLVQVVYDSLKTDRAFLLNASVEEVREFLNGMDMAGLQRMEIAARLLMEESYLVAEQQREMRLKAMEMLTHVQLHDTAFSLERAQWLDELDRLTAKEVCQTHADNAD